MAVVVRYNNSSNNNNSYNVSFTCCEMAQLAPCWSSTGVRATYWAGASECPQCTSLHQTSLGVYCMWQTQSCPGMAIQTIRERQCHPCSKMFVASETETNFPIGHCLLGCMNHNSRSYYTNINKNVATEIACVQIRLCELLAADRDADSLSIHWNKCRIN